MTYPALTLAYVFLKKGEENGVFLNHLKLQKLVYVAHGISLGMLRGPLLKEFVVAWKEGPVIPAIYDKLYHFGNEQVVMDDGPDSAAHVCLLEDKDALNLINAVWNTYGRKTTADLTEITNASDSPWAMTRKYLGHKMSHPIIADAVIEHWFNRILRPSMPAQTKNKPRLQS